MEKFAENCKTFQNFGVSKQMLEKIGVLLCENSDYLKLKDILICFCTFLFHEKILSGAYLVIYMLFLKFTISGFPLKIVNLP